MDSSPPLPLQPSDPSYRNWLDLPLDVTSSILRRLGVVQILTSAQMVCMHWRKVCKDPSMWRTLNMGNYRGDLRSFFLYDLRKICRRAVDLSCGQLVGIELCSFCDDNLLKYITERSVELRSFKLAVSIIDWSFSISIKGWSEVAANIPLLEELELSGFYLSYEKFLEAVGRSCPHLKSLKLKSYTIYWGLREYCNRSAFAIADNMPGLVSLVLEGNLLTDDGLQVILEGCPRLQSLEILHCRHVSLKGDFGRRCSERIKYWRFHPFSDQEYEKILEEYWTITSG